MYEMMRNIIWGYSFKKVALFILDDEERKVYSEREIKGHREIYKSADSAYWPPICSFKRAYYLTNRFNSTQMHLLL